MKNKKGFTLIELLVAIAIIGILTTVVLIATSSSRDAAVDANIKKILGSIRTTPEVYYAKNNSYDNVCNAPTATPAGMIGETVLNARKQLRSGAFSIGRDNVPFAYSATGGTTNAADGSAVCHDSATGWAAVVSLKSPKTANHGWCVDSTGKAKEINTGTFSGNPSDITCD